MSSRHIVTVGASAGGVEALTRLVRGLPPDLPAALFVVLHIPADSHSALPQILSRAGPLPAVHATDGEPIKRGRVYVAPPDRHLLVTRERLRVVRGPRQNGHRPAVDPLFQTAAANYGQQVVGVVLSGALDDGTVGLAAIKRAGGLAVVQSPDEALVASMPMSAIENVDVDYCLPVADVGPLLSRLTAAPARGASSRVGNGLDHGREGGNGEIHMKDGDSIGPQLKPVGAASGFTCPECGGALWESEDGDIVQYSCHVGHGYSADSLLGEQSNALETALWTAYRALEERAALARRLATRARQRRNPIIAERFQTQSEEAAHRASVVWQALTTGERSSQAS